MLSANKPFITLGLCLALAIPLHVQAASDTAGDERAALTRATLELQRDLLLVRERVDPQYGRGLGIYLATGPLAGLTLTRIRVRVNSDTIIDRDLSSAELALLGDGAMPRLGWLALAPGKHIIEATAYGSGGSVSRRYRLEKSGGLDHLRISVSGMPLEGSLELGYRHDSWAAAQ